MLAFVPNKTVLLVDDDEDAREIYVTTLQHAGYPVLSAADGAEALALRHRPDLVVLDLTMPEMDGWKAMELMRAEPALEAAAIVTLTVVGHGEDRRDPVRRGFDGHHVKPVSPLGLLDIVERWIGPPTEAPGPAVVVVVP